MKLARRLLLAAGLLLGALPAAAQPAAPPGWTPIAVRSDGVIYTIQDGARHLVTPLPLSDDDLNAYPEGDEFPAGQVPPGGPIWVAVRSDGVIYVIQDDARHLLTPLPLSDDVINAYPEGDPFASAPLAGPPPAPPEGAPVVKAVLTEWTITTDVTSVPTGPVTFTVQDTGTKLHELNIFKTDRDPKALPIKGSEVDESKVGPKAGEIEGILPGGPSLSNTFTLTPGRYVLFCNLPNHYKQGEVTTLDVT